MTIMSRTDESFASSGRVVLPSGVFPAAAGADPAAAVRVTVTSRLADVAAIWPRAPGDGAGLLSIFQGADFLGVWLATIGQARAVTPYLVTVADATGRPLMLLPLGIWRRQGARVLGFLDGGVSDYNAPIIFPHTPNWSTAQFAVVWRTVLASLPPVDVVVLEKMLETVGGRRNPLTSLGGAAWECSGHAVALTGRMRRRQLPNARASRRKLRRLSEIADTRVVIAGAPAEATPIFETLIAHKSRRFAETRVPGFESAPGQLAFYRAAIADPALSRHVCLAALMCGETAIAEQWALHSGDCLILLVCGTAGGTWNPYSPGRLLNEYLIAHAEESGLSEVDFGIGDEPYKSEYCDKRIALFGVTYAVSRRGRLVLAAQRALAEARRTRLYAAVRPLKWSLLRALSRS